MFFLIFLGAYLLVVTAVTVGVFRRMKKRGMGKALLVTGLTIGLLSLFYPIPIHGGFTFPGEILLHELKSERIQLEQSMKNEQKEAFQQKLAARFSGRLAFSAREKLSGQWSSFRTAVGITGWYDEQGGLAWTDMLQIESSLSPPDLGRAKVFCAEVEPKGCWALPTEAELSLFWRAGGYKFSPLGGYGTVSLLENSDLQIEMPSIRISKNGTYAVRCVALGPEAPAGGYSTKDIPLEEWNAYQLRKTMPGFPDGE